MWTDSLSAMRTVNGTRIKQVRGNRARKHLQPIWKPSTQPNRMHWSKNSNACKSRWVAALPLHQMLPKHEAAPTQQKRIPPKHQQQNQNLSLKPNYLLAATHSRIFRYPSMPQQLMRCWLIMHLILLCQKRKQPGHPQQNLLLKPTRPSSVIRSRMHPQVLSLTRKYRRIQ